MTHSLNFVLPSIHRISKRENKPIVKPQFRQQQHEQQEQQPLRFKLSRPHGRTTSVPSVLPSYQKKDHKLSLNVLVDAIDLDQQMRQFFKNEVMKTKNRTTHLAAPFVPPSIMMARRRSKSAPGAPPSYHQQRAFNSRWIAQDRTVTSESAAKEVAQLIVQKHIESVKNRD